MTNGNGNGNSLTGSFGKIAGSRLAQQSFVVLVLLVVIWYLHNDTTARIGNLEREVKDCTTKYDDLLKMYYFSHENVKNYRDSIR